MSRLWPLTREWLLVTDPDLSRRRLALRGVLTAALAGFTLYFLSDFLGRWVPLSPRAPMLGASLGVLAHIPMRDPSLREQRRTFLLLPLPALAALGLGALVGFNAWLSLGVFVVVVFSSVQLRRFGARGTALGMAGFQSFLAAIFFRADLTNVPGLMVAALIGLAAAYLVRFLIVREHASQNLRRTTEALPAMVSRLLHALAVQLRSPRPLRVVQVRAANRRLNEGALTLEEHLSRSTDPDFESLRRGMRERVFELEVAAGRVLAGVKDLVADPHASKPFRSRFAAALEAAQEAIRGDPTAVNRMTELSHHGLEVTDDQRLRIYVNRLAQALDELVSAADLTRNTSPAVPVHSPPALHAAAPEADEPLHPRTRQAIQVAIATVLSGIAGRWISEDRWFWAVLASFIVIAPSATRGEILVRAWSRSLGTIAGVVLGMALVMPVQGHPRVQLALLFVCIFLGLYSLRSAYAVFVLWFTALLAMLLSLGGAYSTETLWVRILETVVGASIGAVTAALVLPMRTRTEVSRSVERWLQVLEGDLRYLKEVAAAAGSTPSLEPTRELDRALLELRAVAEPLMRNRIRISRETVQVVQRASTVSFYARQLSTPRLFVSAAKYTRARWEEALLTAADNAKAIREALQQDTPVSLTPLSPLLKALREEDSRERPSEESSHQLGLSLLWLERVDSLLRQLAMDLRLEARR